MDKCWLLKSARLAPFPPPMTEKKVAMISQSPLKRHAIVNYEIFLKSGKENTNPTMVKVKALFIYALYKFIIFCLQQIFEIVYKPILFSMFPPDFLKFYLLHSRNQYQMASL
jgi:hypothetical protein